MRFVDETGEERTLNYKDIAKRNIKKQMTINASRMKEEVKDKADTTIKNSIKNKAVNRIKQNSQLNSNEQQTEESKAADKLVDGSTNSLLKYAKKTGKRVRNIQYNSRELKEIDRYEKYVNNVKAKSFSENIVSGTTNRTTTLQKYRLRATQKRLFKQITGKKYSGNSKNLESSLQYVISNFSMRDYELFRFRKKLSIGISALVISLPIFIILITVVMLSNPLKFLAEHESERITLQEATIDVDYAYKSDMQRIRFYFEPLVEQGYYPHIYGGTFINWKDVISIYYCIEKRIDNSPFIFTPDKVFELRNIAYEMYPIYAIEDTSIEFNVQLTYGYQSADVCGIYIPYKTANEMMDIYEFTDAERDQYERLIDIENEPYWNKILATASYNDNPMINLGMNQLGNTGEFYVTHTNFYGSWISDHDTPWCATFISWLVKECEYTDILPLSASVSDFANYFSTNYTNGRFHVVSENTGFSKVDSSYIPQIGDIVIYGLKSSNYNGSTNTWWYADHIGMVVEINDQLEKITVLEGNCSGMVKTTVREYNADWISAYCSPDYPRTINLDTSPELNFGSLSEISTFEYGPNYITLNGDELNPNVNELQVLMKNYNINSKYKFNAYAVVGNEVKVSTYGIDINSTPAEIIMPDGSNIYLYIGDSGYVFYKGKYRHYTYFCMGEDISYKDTVYALIVYDDSIDN